jgi:hypothetical protein
LRWRRNRLILRRIRVKGEFAMKIAAAAAIAVLAVTAPTAEKPPAFQAVSVLGTDAKGPNWTVSPEVRSDGFVRLYTVETTYGKFQVNGHRRMQDRLQELRALAVLEEMSDTKAFADALGSAGLAPIKFGRDLILDPVETTGNLFSGIAGMFDRTVSEVEHSDASRDGFVESVTGVKKAMRELAFELKVDPYTDFTPLQEGLVDVARVMAAGNLSISAAISAIPGGAGIAVSATSTASGLANPIRDKSSAEIAELVTIKLKALGVAEDVIEQFVENTAYSPGDLYVIAEALTTLGAANADAYVRLAAAVQSDDAAKFNRYRAELLARKSASLGNLKEFYAVREFALNRDAKGTLVAAFPFDGLAWTETVERSVGAISQELATRGETRPPVFATTGKLTPRAEAELKKRGWKLVALD